MKIELRFAIVSSFVPTLFVNGAARAQMPTTTRVSVSSSGTEGNGQTTGPLGVSGDGRYVAFCSTATNLVPAGTSGFEHIYVRDRSSGTTEIVSVGPAGVQGNTGSIEPTISEDGRYVAFASYASNLVLGDVNNAEDIFVRDRLSGTTEIVSLAMAGASANGSSGYPSLSADTRYVAFVSSAENLVPGDTNQSPDVFVHDRVNGTNERVSVNSSGLQGVGFGFWAPVSISLDGRYVGFPTTMTNLVPGDTNGYLDAFVHDRLTGSTERVSLDSSGLEGNQKSGYGGVVLSADGRFAAFTSFATNLVAGDTNALLDVFVRDRLNGTTERVNLGPGGAQANSASGAFSISISDGGRYVTFDSPATTLVPGAHGLSDVFLRDRQAGTTELVSVDSNGMPVSGHSNTSSISGNGRFVAFHSSSASLVAGDTNAVSDTFMRDRGTLGPVTYCTAGATTNGCTAQIAATSNPSGSLANACNITVTGVEGQKLGMLFYGINNAGFTPAQWALGSTSWLCVKPPTQRTGIQSSAGTAGLCNGVLGLDWSAYQLANPTALGAPWVIGEKAYVQAWFRDPPAPKTTNLSNAIELTYQP